MSTMCAGSQYSKKVFHLRHAVPNTQASRLGLRPYRLAWVLGTACLKCNTSTKVITDRVKLDIDTIADTFDSFTRSSKGILEMSNILSWCEPRCMNFTSVIKPCLAKEAALRIFAAGGWKWFLHTARPDFHNLSFTLQDTFTDGWQPPTGFTHCFDITLA